MPGKPVSSLGRIGRRAFLGRGAILAGGAAALGMAPGRPAADQSDASLPPNVPPWTTQQGAPILSPQGNEDGGLRKGRLGSRPTKPRRVYRMGLRGIIDARF
jgi:hypothetical protein